MILLSQHRPKADQVYRWYFTHQRAGDSSRALVSIWIWIGLWVPCFVRQWVDRSVCMSDCLSVGRSIPWLGEVFENVKRIRFKYCECWNAWFTYFVPVILVILVYPTSKGFAQHSTYLFFTSDSDVEQDYVAFMSQLYWVEVQLKLRLRLRLKWGWVEV